MRAAFDIVVIVPLLELLNELEDVMHYEATLLEVLLGGDSIFDLSKHCWVNLLASSKIHVPVSDILDSISLVILYDKISISILKTVINLLWQGPFTNFIWDLSHKLDLYQAVENSADSGYLVQLASSLLPYPHFALL